MEVVENVVVENVLDGYKNYFQMAHQVKNLVNQPFYCKYTMKMSFSET